MPDPVLRWRSGILSTGSAAVEGDRLRITLASPLSVRTVRLPLAETALHPEEVAVSRGGELLVGLLLLAGAVTFVWLDVLAVVNLAILWEKFAVVFFLLFPTALFMACAGVLLSLYQFRRGTYRVLLDRAGHPLLLLPDTDRHFTCWLESRLLRLPLAPALTAEQIRRLTDFDRVLDTVAAERQEHATHDQPCSACGKHIAEKYLVRFIRVLAIPPHHFHFWLTSPARLCDACAVRHGFGNALFCLVAGVWSLVGVVATPLAVVANLAGGVRCDRTGMPYLRFTEQFLRWRADRDVVGQGRQSPPAG